MVIYCSSLVILMPKAVSCNWILMVQFAMAAVQYSKIPTSVC